MKTEIWNGHAIRFIENQNEWWAVATDICKALGLAHVTKAIKTLSAPGVTNSTVGVQTGTKQDGTPAIQEVEVKIIDEKNIYRLVFKSRKKEAEEFQDWVYTMLKTLRENTGLEGFQIFRMLDKEHQKEAMSKLNSSLKNPVRVDFIKANVIANKAVSTMYDHKKMLKKDSMTPDMLVKRQYILDSTTDLMAIKDKLNLNLSVSQSIYSKYAKVVQ